MDDSYEAHMTFSQEHSPTVQYVGERRGWSFSQIDGDPILGSGCKCYLTKHTNSDHANGDHKLLEEMKNMAADFESAGIPFIRLKIERIMYDTKTGINRMSEVIC